MEITTTDINTVLALSGVAVTIGSFAHRFRHIFKWRRSEGLKANIARLVSEQAEDRHAAGRMFGSRRATRIAICVNLLLALLMMVALTHRPLRLGLFAYLVMGYFVSKEFAYKAQQPGHDRLSCAARLCYRLFYAAIWPLIKFSRAK